MEIIGIRRHGSRCLIPTTKAGSIGPNAESDGDFHWADKRPLHSSSVPSKWKRHTAHTATPPVQPESTHWAVITVIKVGCVGEHSTEESRLTLARSPLGGSHVLTTQEDWINKAECSRSFVSADGNWYWHWSQTEGRTSPVGLKTAKSEHGDWGRPGGRTQMSSRGSCRSPKSLDSEASALVGRMARWNYVHGYVRAKRAKDESTHRLEAL